MYLSETFWLCLVVMVRMYICRAASRSAALDFSSGPKRSKITSLQLCTRRAKSHISGPFFRFSGGDTTLHREIHATPHPHWHGLTCSQPMWHEILPVLQFFSNPDGESRNTEVSTLTLEKVLLQSCGIV